MLPRLLFILSAILMAFVDCAEKDTNKNCAFWASIGECEENPGYMWENCKESCTKAATELNDESVPSSFYSIVETDLFGHEVHFDRFRGKVVYIVNVASQCGYTKENYEMFRTLKKYISSGLEMVLAPCNAFGNQEPGSASEIAAFAKKNGFEGMILSKGEVNGGTARALFKYLKKKTGKRQINWNFDGKFLVDTEGNAVLPTEDIESDIRGMLGVSSEF